MPRLTHCYVQTLRFHKPFIFHLVQKDLDKSTGGCVSVAFCQCKWHHVVAPSQSASATKRRFDFHAYRILFCILREGKKGPTDSRWHDGFCNVNLDSPQTRMRTLSYCMQTFHLPPMPATTILDCIWPRHRMKISFLNHTPYLFWPPFLSFLEIHFWGDIIYWHAVWTVLLFITLTCTYIVQSFDISATSRTNLI